MKNEVVKKIYPHKGNKKIWQRNVMGVLYIKVI